MISVGNRKAEVEDITLILSTDQTASAAKVSPASADICKASTDMKGRYSGSQLANSSPDETTSSG